MRLTVAVLLLSSAWPVFGGPEEEFRDEIIPILKGHCFDCHSNDKTKGDLNLEPFSTLDSVKAEPEIWKSVWERVQAFEMPPEGKKELDFGKHQRLLKFFRTLPKPETVDCDQIANDRNASFYRGYVMSRRLNRAEYKNTVRDLFGISIPVDDLLPADGGGGEGFDTSGNALFTSTIHIEKYIMAADLILQTVLPADIAGLPPERIAARRRILGEHHSPPPAQARAEAETVVRRVGRLAFRRPIKDEELARALTMFDRAATRGDGYVDSVRLALQAILVSPNFLFLVEEEPEQKGIQPLALLPLASKLSYFLWSSMPDEELLSLAENGQLSDPNVYLAQVRRMVKDPKSRALGERFALQWLDLERLGTEIKPDAAKFPEFDRKLQQSMLAEVTSFFNHIIAEDRPLTELIDADYLFVNNRLAGLYQIPGIDGDEIRKVPAADSKRGGVVTMAAVHTLSSYPLRTSPVLRGRWVLESLIGEKVKPPPPDVPALEEHSDNTKNLSLREQLELHRAKAECASCHDKMDPLGFGLENFDVLGRWREMDKGLPIDAKGILPSGESFTGPAGLKKILMERKKAVMTHLVKKMTGYAYGRELNKFDDCVVERTVKALEESQYKPSVLIEQTVLSFPFRHRFYPKLDVKYDG